MEKALETINGYFARILFLALSMLNVVGTATIAFAIYKGVASETTYLWAIFAIIISIQLWMVNSSVNQLRDEESKKRHEEIKKHNEDLLALVKKLVKLHESDDKR